MPAMKIFSNLEREAFEAMPNFNSAERKQFFAMPKVFIEMMDSLRTPTHQVCFIVTAGYFKAQRRFFSKQFRQQDLDFVARQLGFTTEQVDVRTYENQTYARHQLRS